VPVPDGAGPLAPDRRLRLAVAASKGAPCRHAANSTRVARTMLRDVMRGGTVPPVCLAEVSEQARDLILDGLQRANVEATGSTSLIAKENGNDVEPFIQEELRRSRRVTSSRSWARSCGRCSALGASQT